MEDICRICLERDAKELLSLYFYVEPLDKTYFQMYEYVSGITPSHNNSTFLCLICAEALKTAYLFKEKIEENEKSFSEFMEKKVDVSEDIGDVQMILEPSIEMIVVENDEYIEPKKEPKDEATQKMQQNNEEGVIQCVLCSYKTSKKDNYQKHVERVHKRQKMKCDGCEESFHLIYIMEKHRQVEHGFYHEYVVDVGLLPTQTTDTNSEQLPSIECPLCDYKSSSKANYAKHVKRKHNRQSLQCEDCEESFHLVYVLDEHRREKHNKYEPSSNAVKTNIDESETKKTVVNKDAKAKKDKSVRKYECTDCNLSFDSAGPLKEHRLSVHNYGLVCNHCGEQFPKNKLNAHIKKVHLNTFRQYICDLCGKRANQKSHLVHHMKYRHTSSEASRKTYSCRYCPETFLYTNCRKTHEIRFHTFDYKFQCSLCEKKFVDKTQLNSHLTTHTGEKKHRCVECGRCFRSLTRLNQHKATHSDLRPFSCTTCTSSFKTKKGLRVHRQRHAEQNYECPHCFKEFKVNDLLRTHLMNHHPEYELPPKGTILNKNALLRIDAISQKYDVDVSSHVGFCMRFDQKQF